MQPHRAVGVLISRRAKVPLGKFRNRGTFLSVGGISIALPIEMNVVSLPLLFIIVTDGIGCGVNVGVPAPLYVDQPS